ncbi:MAG TPA: hypothetical protein VMV32_09090 [Ignavibacteriaceae bacterium]|nr:hypothetical protein [Ignavibacteriaceae bacterium]
MTNLRTRAITDLKKQNTKNWSTPVIYQDPDGIIYNIDNETGEELRTLQTLYDRRVENPDTGEAMTVHEPVIVQARSSLSRIPAPGEKWSIKFPLDPMDETVLSNYVFTPDRSIEGGSSLGFFRIYPIKLVQS